MRSHAKAPSAEPTQRQASGLGGGIRGAFAARGDAGDADGSGATSHRSKRIAIVLLAVALAALALVPSATAFLTRTKSASFGPDGTALTSFGSPQAVAFNQAIDRLYVLDISPAKIHAFEAPALTLSGGAFPLDVFASVPSSISQAIAVDNSAGASSGNVYYVERDTDTIYGYKADGTPLGGAFPIILPASGFPCGAAVDSTGTLFVADAAADSKLIRKFDSTGTSLGTISIAATGSACSIALDSNGDLFFSTIPLGGGVQGLYKYTAASGYNPSSVLKIPWIPGSFRLSPQALAVDTVTHTVYAADVNRVSAFDADGTPLYTFGEGVHGAGAEEPHRGIAVDEGTGTVYLPDSASDSKQVHVFGPAQDFADATATPSPADGITDTSAELSGTLTDNNVLPTNWRIELSANDGTTWSTLSSGKTSGAQSNLTISTTASGLFPNSSYRFRIVTNKGTTASTEVASFSRAFKTVAPPPVIEDVGAVQISNTSARMVATIDPRNTDTGYVFQYGLTPALGSSTEPVNIGSGTTPITVSQPLGGLAPDTTYYFRVVATNLTGTTEGTTKTLHTRAAPLPSPEHRAWEQVSPVDKNFGDANAGYGGTRAGVSLDGNAVGFCSSNLFGEPPGKMSFLCAPYLSRRTATGWETPNNLPEYCKTDPVSGNEDGGLGVIPSADYSRVVLVKAESEGCSIPPLDPAAPMVPGEMSFNLYLQNPLADPPTYDLLNSQSGGIGWTAQSLAGGSDDYSHVVIRSDFNQTAPPDSPPPGNFKKVYDFSQQGVGGCVQPGGCLSLVSRDTNNVPFTTPSAIPAIYNISGAAYELASAVSDDGERIFFANADSLAGFPSGSNAASPCSGATCEIYLREGGTVTHEVSATECTTACGTPQSKGDYFLSATPSGQQAFFTSCARLSDDASPEGCAASALAWANNGRNGSKLYRWDLNGAPGHKLVDLTADHEPSDGTQPDFRGLIGHSEDGEVAYFVTGGQIVTGEPTFPSTFDGLGTFTGAKIYRWRWNGGSPSVDYLGPYETLRGNWGSDMNLMQQHRQVSSDGAYLMLYSNLALDPAGDRDTDTDVYRWSEAEGWLCASCQAPGAPSGGDVDLSDVWFEYSTGFFPEAGNLEQRIYMSEDGQRIFFGTPDALVPEDVNGEASCALETFTSGQASAAHVYACEDVYEWHDGTVSLVSSGIGTSAARLIATTPTGRDVFFYTRERLVGWDRDDGVDIYDARLGGGFPEPPPQPPSCEGEGCRGQVTTPATGAGAGTAQFEGAPDPAPKRSCPKGQVKRRGACVKKKRAKRAHKRAAAHKRRAQR